MDQIVGGTCRGFGLLFRAPQNLVTQNQLLENRNVDK